MSGNQSKGGLVIKGPSRSRELRSFVISLGARGLSRKQARPIAKAYAGTVTKPPIEGDEFAAAWKDAWAELMEEERESYFDELINVQNKKAEFLLFPYLPQGALTIMDGDPGMGKSLVTAQLGAMVTKGSEFANGQRSGKGRVLYLSPEDEPDRILRPRLEAHGADVSKIRFMNAPFLMDDFGIEVFRRELIAHPAALAIIDPLSAFIPSSVDIYRANESRGFMRPLAMLARDLNMSILVVRHMRKASAESAIQAGQGSMDFIASVRSGLVVMGHPADPETRVFAQSKANYSRKGPSITFEVVGFDQDSVPKIQWNGEIPQTADQLVQSSKKPTALEGCAAMIKDMVTGEGIKARDALDRLTAAGYSARTIDDAKVIANVKSGRGPGAMWRQG
ncbi:hypothetical protein TomTYG75_01400 [Sphingobium sp. TomTYG75]